MSDNKISKQITHAETRTKLHAHWASPGVDAACNVNARGDRAEAVRLRHGGSSGGDHARTVVAVVVAIQVGREATVVAHGASSVDRSGGIRVASRAVAAVVHAELITSRARSVAALARVGGGRRSYATTSVESVRQKKANKQANKSQETTAATRNSPQTPLLQMLWQLASVGKQPLWHTEQGEHTPELQPLMQN